jgi:hypothetical protein
VAILTTPTWKHAAVVTVAWGLAGGVLLWTTAFNLLMRKPGKGPVGAMLASFLVGMLAAVGGGVRLGDLCAIPVEPVMLE